VSDVTCVRVAGNVGDELVSSGVSVADSQVARLVRLELLLDTQFVGLKKNFTWSELSWLYHASNTYHL
jgi:hypothetical protein